MRANLIATRIAVTGALLFACAAAVASSPSAGPGPTMSADAPQRGAGSSTNRGDPVASLYGHVARITDGHGKTERIWLAANHTFTWQGSMGERGHGTWQLRGNEICLAALTEADPAGRPRERQTPAPARCAEFRAGHGAGESWTQNNDRGQRVTVHVE
jgi:hypothetical protein